VKRERETTHDLEARGSAGAQPVSGGKICPQCGARYPAEQRFCPLDGASLRAESTSADLVGQVLADRYHIIKLLGEGGMGRVYLAEHVRMHRRSAVKVMSPGMIHDADAVSRFNREAANASQITHPSVAAVYDFGETREGLIFLAMEYVDGEPLTALLERQGGLPAGRAALIARQVAEGLAAAHELGIVHRDLKPDNIMVGRGKDGRDIIKIVDFGIAKAMQGDDQNVTKTGLAVGTPEYMSPEQLAGDKIDQRTDIYSLGLVTFNMFTGTLPFPSVTSKEALVSRLTEKPRTLAEMKGDVRWPPTLQRVMDRALANEVHQRYQDVLFFSRDLVAAVNEMPDVRISGDGTLTFTKLSEAPTDPLKAGAGGGGDDAEEKKETAPRGNRAVAGSRGAATAASRRPTTPMPKPSRAPLFVGGLVVVALAGVGWYFRANLASFTRTGSAATPAPPSASASAPGPRTDSAGSGATGALVRDSLALTSAANATPTGVRGDSAGAAQVKPVGDSLAQGKPATATASTPGAATPSVAAAPAAPKVVVPAGFEDSLAPIRQEIASALARKDDGDYESAFEHLGTARDKLQGFVQRYPGAAPLTPLRRRLTQVTLNVRDACMEERRMLLARGEEAPKCR
jgi:predicted Ser/Thr protein kinase